MNEEPNYKETELNVLIGRIAAATNTAEADVRRAVEVVIAQYNVPLYNYEEMIRKVQAEMAKVQRAFRNKDYVTARGKKVISRGVSRSGGTCSRSYALNHERNMLARNKKAKLKGKHRRALEDF